MGRVARVAPNLLNTIVIADPRPVRAPTIAGGVFGFDSSFPAPGIISYIHEIGSIFRVGGGRRISVFGHTDAVGSEAYNKELADRRAQAVLALLATDVSAFDAVCQLEGWSLREHQAMLRALGCDPGPPDGEAGSMTTAALRAFQKGYAHRLWFETYQEPRYPSLAVNGELDEPTAAAIRDAYVNYIGASLPPHRIGEPRFAGCGEFNHLRADAEQQRRVTLAVFEAGEPSGPIPCTVGDVAACTVDKEKPRRCSFYRTHVDEPDDPRVVRAFLEDHWMPTPSGAAYMSTLCALPDDSMVKFTVYRARATIPEHELTSFDDDELPDDIEEVATVDGAVVAGVAFAVWKPKDDRFLPFQTRSWFDDSEIEPTDLSLAVGGKPSEDLAALYQRFRQRHRYRPPIFKVEGEGQWLLSRPPGRRLRGLVVDGVGERGVVVTPSGTMMRVDSKGSRPSATATVAFGDWGYSLRNDEAPEE